MAMKTNVRALRALADALESLPRLPEVPHVDIYQAEVTGFRFQLTSRGSEAAEVAAQIVKEFPANLKPVRRADHDEYMEWGGKLAGVPVKVIMLRQDAYVPYVPTPAVTDELHPALVGAL